MAPCETKPKTIYDSDGTAIPASHINGYLCDAPDVFVESRPRPLCDVPPMNFGNMPRDGGNLILARVEACRQTRLASKAAATRKFAATPGLFCQITQPPGKDYIAIPRVSSERRAYVPIGFLTAETIVTDLLQIVPDATLYHFGILTSRMHNAWMRAVAGRLKSAYRYSKDIVYNNFVWPEGAGENALDKINRIDRIEESGVVGRDVLDAPSAGERDARPYQNPVNPVNPVETDSPRSPDLHGKIFAAAQAVLDARALYPGSSLADLYDPLTMPPELVKAHAHLDALVDRAYGLSPSCTDAERVVNLFALYAEKVEKLKSGEVEKFA